MMLTDFPHMISLANASDINLVNSKAWVWFPTRLSIASVIVS